MISCLVVIPTYGRHDLTTGLLAQLTEDGDAHLLVIDNRGDFDAGRDDVEVVRPGRNLRWIGSANYGLRRALAGGYAACAVLNNDLEISAGFVRWLALAFEDVSSLAVVAPTYNCYWPHQRRQPPPGGIGGFVPTRAYRELPFCDGTAFMVSAEGLRNVGYLDAETFSWHGYGADIDYGIRVRECGMRTAATEGCYAIHQRRATIRLHEDDLERRILAEYQGGLVRKWGKRWQERAGLRGRLVDPVWD